MNTVEITVEARAAGPGGPAGETKSALLMVCDCESEAFYVYAIAGHLHLQCEVCGATYCRGEERGCGYGMGMALPARKCRVCGCTDYNACATPEGGCHWVEADLCSACAARGIVVLDAPNKKGRPNHRPSDP